MRNLKLDTTDLQNLVKGTTPGYEQMELPIIKANGDYTGGFVDKWSWHLKSNLTEDELIDIYNICKK